MATAAATNEVSCSLDVNKYVNALIVLECNIVIKVQVRGLLKKP